MTPIFLIDGLSSEANDRILSITVNDKAGFKSDRASFSIDNRDFKVEFPKRGRIFKILLGYSSSGLVSLGTFQLDTVKFSDGNQGAVLNISANAQYHHENSVKAPREDNWEQKTFSEIVETIAGRNGYQSEVDSSIADIFFDHISQNESDAAFVQRLAEEHDAYLKYQDNKMIVVSRQSFNGNVVIVTRKNSLANSLSFTVNSRNKYESVRTYWHSDTARRISEVAGSGEPEFKIQKTYSSKPLALAAAAAKLKKLRHGQVKINNLSLIGNPNIRAGTVIKIEGFHSAINGEWEVASADHQLDSSGYRTTIQCEGDDNDDSK